MSSSQSICLLFDKIWWWDVYSPQIGSSPVPCWQYISSYTSKHYQHDSGTSSPSHWQQVEEQAPTPVGWTMCFLLMTLVPVQKLCVNIYVYIYMYFPYTSSVIGRIYNGIVIQYWRSCTPSRSIGECAVPGLNAILCFLWFTNCVLLFDKNLLLGCLWHLVFV